MGKWELSDDTLLRVAGLAGAFYGVHAFAAPKHFHDTYMEAGQPCSTEAWRWFGQNLMYKSALDVAITASDPSQKTMKNALKLNGLAGVASAAHMVCSAQDNTMRKEAALGSAGALLALGALCLYRGFKEE